MTRQTLAEQRRSSSPASSGCTSTDYEIDMYSGYVPVDNELPLFLGCQLSLMSCRSVFYSYMYRWCKGSPPCSHPPVLSLSRFSLPCRYEDSGQSRLHIGADCKAKPEQIVRAPYYAVYARFVTRIRSLLHPKRSLIGLEDLLKRTI